MQGRWPPCWPRVSVRPIQSQVVTLSFSCPVALRGLQITIEWNRKPYVLFAAARYQGKENDMQPTLHYYAFIIINNSCYRQKSPSPSNPIPSEYSTCLFHIIEQAIQARHENCLAYLRGLSMREHNETVSAQSTTRVLPVKKLLVSSCLRVNVINNENLLNAWISAE